MQNLRKENVRVVVSRKPGWRSMAAAKRALKRPRTKKKAKTSIPSLSKLMKLLDGKMSLYVRLSGADENGICTCYTCGHKAHYKKMQNGHFISRFYKATRFDLSNTRIQCPMCNIWKRGDLPTFRENLVRDMGNDAVLALEAKRKQVIRRDREAYTLLIAAFDELLSSLHAES